MDSSRPTLRRVETKYKQNSRGHFPHAQSSVTTFSTNKTNEPKPLPPTPVDSAVSFEDMNFTSKIRHFENELRLRSGQPLGNKPKFSNNNNEENGETAKMNNGSENIPVAVRTIPIKVERNGSSHSQPPQKFSISVKDGAERKIPTILNTNHVSNSNQSAEAIGARVQPKDLNSYVELQFVDEDHNHTSHVNSYD
ncbi:hypothetical protein M3Y99_00057900 [Aphelenchoides fujianensis]|nr:hypothetical protein M3Y99_00057900 [Aphelenchoides fujianensis]